MNFQQLRAVREATRNAFNLTEVASVLHTSQPGISRQIRELEDELGMGVGIVASIAFDEERDLTLRALDARHLFEINLTRLGIRRGAWLRGYVYDFIEAFAPTLTRAVVQEALAPPRGAEPGGEDTAGSVERTAV
jgi:LysR family cys regulon transcriptional activator